MTGLWQVLGRTSIPFERDGHARLPVRDQLVAVGRHQADAVDRARAAQPAGSELSHGRNRSSQGVGPNAVPGGRATGGLFDATSFLDDQDMERESQRSRLLNPYYAVKPLLPRAAQLAMRRVYARRQARRPFPAWPIETLLVDQLEERLLAELEATRGRARPVRELLAGRVGASRRSSPTTSRARPGCENIPRVLEIERRYGLRSSWNFVAERLPDRPAASSMRARGGLRDRTARPAPRRPAVRQPRRASSAQLPRIHRGDAASGTRSASARRPPTASAAWMPELGCLYDSSFPDTDPFEPQPGGCCSIWPFFLEDLVELPITMPQDHTLFEILQGALDRRWVQKSDWLAQQPRARQRARAPRLPARRSTPGPLRAAAGPSQRAVRAAGTPCPVRSPAGGAYAPAWSARRRPAIAPAADAGPSFEATTAHARKEGERIAFEL